MFLRSERDRGLHCGPRELKGADLGSERVRALLRTLHVSGI